MVEVKPTDIRLKVLLVVAEAFQQSRFLVDDP